MSKKFSPAEAEEYAWRYDVNSGQTRFLPIPRCVGFFIFECNGANPNGGPDAQGRPRTLRDYTGWITDVSIKAKVRFIMADHESDVFKAIQEKFGFNPDNYHVWESFYRGTTGLTPVEAKNQMLDLFISDPQAAINKYFDVRIFGSNILEEKDKKDKNKPSRKFIKTGVVTITNPVSIASIDIEETTLSKKADLDDAHLMELQGTLAPDAKKFVEHGLYVSRICVNSHIARHTNTTKEDIEVLKFVLPKIFNFTGSASRPVGSIIPRHLWWYEHKNALGDINEYDFWENLTPSVLDGIENPKSIRDYYIPTPEKIGLINVVDLV